MDEYPRSTLIR